MKLSVPQEDLICNLRYVRQCDYVYSYTEWLDKGITCEIRYNSQFVEQVKNDLRSVITIYYKLDYSTILNFFNKIRNINKKFILISGCSDYSIESNIFINRPSNIIKWYGININHKDINLISLPMGSLSGTWIGNSKNNCEIYKHSNFKQVMINNKKPVINNLVFMCFSLETNSKHRTNVYNYFNNKIWVTNLCKYKTNKYLPDNIFMDNVYNHSFVISPFGNGIDCGRTWMTLQLGSIPLMPYHLAFEDWANNLPIILYHDINEITEEYLKKKLEEFKTRTFNYNYLNTNYWKNKWEQDKKLLVD